MTSIIFILVLLYWINIVDTQGARDCTTKETEAFASIHMKNKSICGGSLVKADWVITSAQCCAYIEMYKQPLGLEAFKVKVGKDVLTPDFKDAFQIQEVFKHKKYTVKPVWDNNICVVKLKRDSGEEAKTNILVQPEQFTSLLSTVKCDDLLVMWYEEIDSKPKVRCAQFKLLNHKNCQSMALKHLGLVLGDGNFCISDSGSEGTSGNKTLPSKGTESPIKDKTETPINGTNESPIKDKTETPIKDKTETPIKDKTETPIKDKIEAPIGDKIETTTKDNVGALVTNKVEMPINNTTEAPKNLRNVVENRNQNKPNQSKTVTSTSIIPAVRKTRKLSLRNIRAANTDCSSSMGGGPVFCDDLQVAVLSADVKCGLQGRPLLNVRVDWHMHFIEDIMNCALPKKENAEENVARDPKNIVDERGEGAYSGASSFACTILMYVLIIVWKII